VAVAESQGERINRELMELLQELRVLIPGVQVLFAFLLTVPFTQVFGTIDGPERLVFFGAFVSTTISAVLLIAPSVRHRIRFRERDKEALVQSGNRLALSGTIFLAVAISLVAVLVTERLYGWTWAVAAGVGALLLQIWFWYVWGILREIDDSDFQHEPSALRRH
jgi:uncharacterized protein DUF6328